MDDSSMISCGLTKSTAVTMANTMHMISSHSSNSSTSSTATTTATTTATSTSTTTTATTTTTNNNNNNTNHHRAVHRIRLSSLVHNYNLVEAAAAKQKCNVIVVVKADGYGHGATHTAVHLAQKTGADAFAVATLEEGILLRKALTLEFTNNNSNSNSNSNSNANANNKNKAARMISSSSSNNNNNNNNNTTTTTKGNVELTSMFQPPPSLTLTTDVASLDNTNANNNNAATTTTTTSSSSRRASHIRILVLGPPVGYPRCFDDYYHYSIECMVSGPEVASAILEWVANPLDHKRGVVERVAQETLLSATTEEQCGDFQIAPMDEKSATLSGNTGKDLIKEYKQFLANQLKATQFKPIIPTSSTSTSTSTSSTQQHQQHQQQDSSSLVSSPHDSRTTSPSQYQSQSQYQSSSFGGIEAARQSSANRQKTEMGQVFIEDSKTNNSLVMTNTQNNGNNGNNNSNNNGNGNGNGNGNNATTATTTNNNIKMKRRLKWHALVDTGMGRMGFKTELFSGQQRDTVEILQELVQAEIHNGAPLEFYGMCTHMADANSTSTYTNDQITKFKSLLRRVRDAGLSVPTVSTDNSAALLTTNLTHFDPDALLTQSGLNTRGYVRIGGAIYGQRPAFPQLQAVSTLQAAVRHVAILKEGESVGYDRSYIAPHQVRIATLTIGFADGYPRELGNGKGQVAIRSKLYPVAGNVCMDMMMVELEGDETDVRVGDVAVLWGGVGVPLKDVALALGTTQSVLTCGLNKSRVLREYV